MISQKEEIMNYLIGTIVYLVVGSLLTMGIWKVALSLFANKDKKRLLFVFLAMIALLWPYWLVTFFIAIFGGAIEALITKKEPFFTKMPFIIFVAILGKMYERMWGVKLFPKNFEEYKQEA